MALRRTIALFILLLVSASCGNTHKNNNTPVFLSNQISSAMPAFYKDGNQLISTLKRHQLTYDTDADGIIDKEDPDIDGDTIPNDCDLAPFDRKIGMSDQDGDGIPDFCDFNPTNHKARDTVKSQFQKNLFKEKGFILIEDDLPFQENDIFFLSKLVEHISIKATMPHKKLQTITLTKSLALGEYGAYDSDWANIRYKKDNVHSEDIPSIKLWQWVLAHEFFHFVATVNPQYFADFHVKYSEEEKNGSLIYPTKYSEVSEEEYFAEWETGNYFGL